MKRKFITNLALVIFLNLLVKPFWIFGIDRTVQNVVGAADYGGYFSLLNFSLLLNILMDAGITSFNNRAIARDPGKLDDLFSNIAGIKFMLAVFYAVVCITLAIILDYSKQQLYMLLFLVLNQFLASYLLYLRSNISGLHQFRTDSLISVLDRSIVIVICSVLLWTRFMDQPFRIIWFVYAQTAAYGITVLVAFIVVYRYASFFRPGFSLTYFTGILRQSYPFALLILLMTFYNRIDSVMLERLLPDGKVQAGIYAQSFRILDAAAMFAFLFAGLLFPIFSRMLKQGDSIGEMLKLSYSLIMVPAITLAAVGFFYAEPIMDWMYNEYIATSARIFPFLMFGFIAISTTYIFGTLLTANNNLKELNILALSAVILNIVLNFVLIPKQQAIGAALASLFTQGYMALAQVFLSVWRIKPGIKIEFTLRLAVFTGLIFVTAWVCNNYISTWYAGIVILVLAAILLGLTTGLLKRRDLFLLIRKEEE